MKKTALSILFCLVGYLGLVAQIDYDNPKTYKIGGLDVEGCQYTSKNSVIIHSGLGLGQEITLPGSEISKAMKSLWDQKVFSEVAISADNVVDDKIFLLIKVTERPRISSFSFKGDVTKSQADDLKGKMNFFLRGTIWNAEKERRARRVIENYYMEKAYYTTDVTFDVVESTNDMAGGVKVYMNVKKGPKVKINEIKIEGNQDFSDKRLKAKMKTLKEKLWWRLWARSKYLPKKLDEAKANLIAFYRNNGYRDAEVVFDSTYMFDEKTLDIDIKVLEGSQYYIRNIEFVGNFKFGSDSLKRILGIEKGDIYNSELIDQRLHGDQTGRDVSGLYLDDGYLFFNVEPIEVAVVGDSVDLEFRMFEGPQARIRKIIVEGNTKTSDYVILRELRTLPGQKFSRTDLIRSQREILNLGYFNQENLQVLPIPDPVSGTVDIKYVVEEKPSDQLQVQGGWGGRIRDTQGNVIGGGFVGTVQLGFNNFSTKRFFQKKAWSPIPSGDGQKLNLAVQMNGVGWQNYSISFLEPWLGGKKPNSLGASVYYTINQNQTTKFRMKTLGGGLDYGMRLKWPDDFFKAFASLNYKYYDIRNGNQGFGSLSFGDAFINIISARLTIDRTSIDAPVFPRSGSAINFSVEATPPYSTIKGTDDFTDIPDAEKFKFLEYHKWKFSSTWYFQIFKNLVVKPKVQYGFLGNYNPSYGISPFERFYMGGSGLGAFNFYGWEYVGLRGYPDNSIGPLPEGSASGAQPTGGNIYNKYTLELRYPITLNQAAPIWVVGFAEAGNTWMGVNNFKPFELKRSAGVGLRVMLPMVGLLGVDWGYGFDKINSAAAKPHGSQFTFLIGQEF
ncbi:MAG: outer membrane protein assembly factor BamA [Bacteroidia bacterium]|nr:outer membrane protein assembly factor BamA [Bacteroidota bacterium]MBP6639295.1 outer membrane protein assembly factor BamA [Bacteroidia bacterium]MBP8073361.1 outer membrane protein assembly factor BamA [Bacteroidia bacterium]